MTKSGRKVTAITFTEKNNELVRNQPLPQAQGMVDYWLGRQSVNTVANDAKVFTLNVLAAALFNKTYPFEGVSETKTPDETANDSGQYRDSLGRIPVNIVPIFVFGQQGLKAWWMPKSGNLAGTAISTFRSYVTGLIDEERDCIVRGEKKNQHLVAALVRACETEKQEDKHAGQGKKDMTLTEEEIISNLYVDAFAGNDTTAIALNKRFVRLAAFPDKQDWIAEEIQHFQAANDTSKMDLLYFPQLKRCLAVVVESLRFNHPLGQLVKQTGNFSQSLKIGSRDVTVPPGTAIHLSLAAMHTHPQYWGEDYDMES